MSDPTKSIPPHVVAEVAATAHEVRAMSERLLALAEALPTPPDELLEVCMVDRGLLDRYPAFELSGDLEVAVADGLKPVAEELEAAVQRIRKAETRSDVAAATETPSTKERR